MQAAIDWMLAGSVGQSPLLPLLARFDADIHNVAIADSDQTGLATDEASVPVVQSKALAPPQKAAPSNRTLDELQIPDR